MITAAGPTPPVALPAVRGQRGPGRPAEPRVTALLVACDGARWLPRALAGLRSQVRAPDRIVALDTGSRDDSPALLRDALGEDAVVTVPRGTSFGAAVAAHLNDSTHDSDAAQPPVTDPPEHEAGSRGTEWLWLLHDDCEPSPTALACLLQEVASDSRVAVAGPKVSGWRDERLLLELGVTIAPGGRRETGLDPAEQDQGQHDGRRRVLAVGSAGMLVRADVFAAVGGFDPHLAAFRDDVDLCWRIRRAGGEVVCVPGAVVRHAEAAAHGRRPVPAAGRAGARVHRLDRRAALWVLLANRPARELPLHVVRLVLGSLTAALGYLLGKLPGQAADELLALLWVLARPRALWRARRWRARSAVVAHREAVGGLLGPSGATLRHAGDLVLTGVGRRLAPSGTRPPRRALGRPRAVEPGPVAEEAEDFEATGSGALRQALTRPGLLLGLGLTVLTAIAARNLFGGGSLVGGALLPAPDGAGALWRTAAGGWQPVGLGSDTPPAGYVGVLAMLSTLLLGSARLATDLVLLGAVPLAGMSAYLSTRSLTRSVRLRVWAAATYALLPGVTGAVGGGRVGTALAAVLLPPLAVAVARTLRLGGSPGGRQAPWAAALLLTAVTAAVPVGWVLAAAVLPVLALLPSQQSNLGLGQRLRGSLVVLGVPLLVLAPQTAAAVRDPRRLLAEPGLLDPAIIDRDVPAAALVLLHPGGPGMFPVVLSAGVLLAALAGLLRSHRGETARGGWALALVATTFALALPRFDVAGTAGSEIPAWPGLATLAAGLGLLVAGVVAGERARRRLGGFAFGWRQPVAWGVTALAVLAPLGAAASWAVRGADDPLRRQAADVLPAFITAVGDQQERPRSLVLAPAGPAVRYTLARDAAVRLGEAELRSARAADERLAAVVSALVSGAGSQDVTQDARQDGGAASLAGLAVRYVVLRPGSPTLARTIDAVPGLSRVDASGGTEVWRVDGVTARLRVVGADGSALALPAGRVGAQAAVPAAPAPSGDGGPRQLVLAEAADPGWQATLDGRRLPRTLVDGWAQGFVLPDTAGRLVLEHSDTWRRVLLWGGVAVLLLVVVLALPSARSPYDASTRASGGDA